MIKLKGQRILVVEGAGFIGSHLVDQLVIENLRESLIGS